MLAVGLMSGTSLDGVDAALCHIEGSGLDTQVDLLNFVTIDIPSETRQKIQKACLNQADTRMICSLNFELGHLMAQAVQTVCLEAGRSSKDLDFVASHGQTLYHLPIPKAGECASTLQLGEPAVIATSCQCPVISNFRTKDMAMGGQGAPLVPYADWILYSQPDKYRVLQNIGGIGNLTYLPKRADLSDLLAFDTGPGNMMINRAIEVLFQKSYDQDGQVARQGQRIYRLARELQDHPYLHQPYPKTTGREDFGNELTEALLDKYPDENREDIIHTLTWFTAYSMGQAYQELLNDGYLLDQVILAGGGAHNPMIKALLIKGLEGLSIEVVCLEDLGDSSDAKEAIAFVILGNETLRCHPSNVPKATGAKEPTILGNITY